MLYIRAPTESPQYSWGVGANYLQFHGTQVSIIREETPFLQYSMELYLACSSLVVGVVDTVSCQPNIHFLLWKKGREEGRTENEKKGQKECVHVRATKLCAASTGSP